jgi:DNA-binding transcriptional ArsR family regulator
VDEFTVIADGTRRKILDRLGVGESDVSGLIEALGLPRPLVSKHLRVLREAGVVTAAVAGNRRVYRLAADPGVRGSRAAGLAPLARRPDRAARGSRRRASRRQPRLRLRLAVLEARYRTTLELTPDVQRRERRDG